ncbi:hypothetical protein OIU84_025470 [Salix udensis]|uniref:NLE domain-containing protein n=1 Tax=Salix udensis TaxID=889485 RepID=A0AAD6KJN5_9ROSI|nr:hypothetical protein OIU84_025470 [Salix udensis]
MEDETVNNIICQFTDPEGTPLKAPLYIPQNAGPRQIVNKLLNNEEKLPYAFFYIGSRACRAPRNLLAEKQRFGGEGAANCLSAASYFPNSSRHKNWVLCTAWSPDGKHLVSGSKAGELQCWAPQAGKPSGNPLVVKSLTIRLADILAIYTDRGNPMQLKNQL